MVFRVPMKQSSLISNAEHFYSTTSTKLFLGSLSMTHMSSDVVWLPIQRISRYNLKAICIHMWPRTTINVAQPKLYTFLKFKYR